MGAPRVELSKSAIENIFKLRMNGQSFRAIAERYPLSDNYVRKIIDREVFGHVELDAGLVKGAQGAKRAAPVKRKKPTQKKKPTYADHFSPLVELMKAQAVIIKAKRACKEAGLSDEFIELAMEEVGRVD